MPRRLRRALRLPTDPFTDLFARSSILARRGSLCELMCAMGLPPGVPPFGGSPSVEDGQLLGCGFPARGHTDGLKGGLPGRGKGVNPLGRHRPVHSSSCHSENNLSEIQTCCQVPARRYPETASGLQFWLITGSRCFVMSRGLYAACQKGLLEDHSSGLLSVGGGT